MVYYSNMAFPEEPDEDEMVFAVRRIKLRDAMDAILNAELEISLADADAHLTSGLPNQVVEKDFALYDHFNWMASIFDSLNDQPHYQTIQGQNN